MVAPFAGAWIEIFLSAETSIPSSVSLPSRERGLKSVYNKLYESSLLVAPFAGAWIEIVSPAAVCILTKSLPSRERGLKLY